MLYGAQCAPCPNGEVKSALYRCPGGSTRGGGTCVNINECFGYPCLNGGTCIDREPARRYDCICAYGYTGHDCELELLASGIITPSRDFIIAIIVCLFMLLGEHRRSFVLVYMHAFPICLLRKTEYIAVIYALKTFHASDLAIDKFISFLSKL